MADVIVLRPGYAYLDASGALRAGGTITLVVADELRILVDTGGPRDRALLMDALARHHLTPEEIRYVVCTHGHIDHVSNNNLFPRAEFLMGRDHSVGDSFSSLDFSTDPIAIASGVQLLATPGHTSEDISVLVRADSGVVAIVGDLFEGAADLENEQLWISQSRDPELQRSYRSAILALADFIVPGHGDSFATDYRSRTFGPA